MQIFITSLLLIWFTLSFNFCSNGESKPILIQTMQQKNSTLDSLQGKWISEEDSLDEITINGRFWTEKYNDVNNSVLINCRLYFSDTAIDNENPFNAISIDTNALTGKFIILASPTNNSFDCLYNNGFLIDNTDTTFSIRPAIKWTMASVQVYKKFH